MNSPKPLGLKPGIQKERKKERRGDEFNKVYPVIVPARGSYYCMQISLTLLVAADHGVTLVSREVSNGAKPEVILCPLNRSLLVEDPARKRHPAANHRGLIHRLDRESLINYFRGRDRLHRRGER